MSTREQERTEKRASELLRGGGGRDCVTLACSREEEEEEALPIAFASIHFSLSFSTFIPCELLFSSAREDTRDGALTLTSRKKESGRQVRDLDGGKKREEREKSEKAVGRENQTH